MPTSILGQDRALDILAAALRSGRFHHGWILAGPRGVGKFAAAMHAARTLLDPACDPQSVTGASLADGPPPSKVQHLIDAGSHPDLHIIRKELALFSDERKLRERKQTNIPIDLLRERVIGGEVGGRNHDAAAYRTAAHGHGKAFIIDEAELLDDTGQNAMLKTLEEPPAQTWFFLITTRPDELLPTIRSRCQTVRFGALDSAAMHKWFRAHAAGDPELAAQHKSLPPWIELFADGSPGAALLAMQYDFALWQKTLDPMLAELDRGRFPDAMGETLGKLADEFAVAWVKAHKNASKDAANKDGARHVMAILATHVRNRLAQSVTNHGNSEHWGEAIDLIRECERQIESNVNQKQALENLVAQWANLDRPRTMATAR
jgi:DNA polymerase-3 subunit delta'